MAKLTEAQAAKARANGRLGGRPPECTADELEQRINDYFDSHNTKDNIPKWPEMLNHIRLSDSTLLRYRTDEKYIKDGYADVIKRAEHRFSSTLIQLGINNPNLQSLIIFLLKQPHNGGYTDKQQVDTNNKHQIEVNIKGV